MPKGKGKHLTIADRVRIEDGIKDKESFSSIARRIGVSASTISREVKNNRYAYLPRGMKKVNLCAYKAGCTIKGLCEINCQNTFCRSCRSSRCNSLCESFEQRICNITQKTPFVCNDCKMLGGCGFRRYTYRAIYANEVYEGRLVSTRQGISITPEQLSTMVRTVKRLLGQGQSLEAIWATHAKDFPVGLRTFYNYIESGLFGIANLELPRKVRYKPRKKPEETVKRIDRVGRSFSDYCALSEEEKRSAAQMDCVMGTKGDFKCILTLHLPRFEFQLYVLLTDHTKECVVGALDWIESLCAGRFKELFGVILTDRGSEFSDFEAIERSAFSPQRRCRVYYCDPMCSNQKGSCEKNHVELRRIIPKGTSLEELTNYDLAKVASHINSYPRPSLGGLSPYGLASQALPQSLLEGLGITLIYPDEVIMKPDLLKKS